MSLFRIVVSLFCAFIRTRSELALENLALRQQLAILEHKSKRPCLRKHDRNFWVFLKRIWPNWRSVLVIVQPDTVVRCVGPPIFAVLSTCTFWTFMREFSPLSPLIAASSNYAAFRHVSFLKSCCVTGGRHD